MDRLAEAEWFAHARLSESPSVVRVDGGDVGYAEYGDPDGRPILFFHGIPGSRLLGRVLHDAGRSSAARIVALERPGCGLSDHRRARSVADCARVAGAAADELGIGRFCSLGVSGGGPYALACAQLFPERVPAVGVVSSVGTQEEPGLVLRSSRLLVALGRFSPLLVVPPLALARRQAARRYEQVLTAVEDELAADGVDHPQAARLLVIDCLEAFAHGSRGVAGDCGRIRRWGFAPENVPAPVHLWHGRDDRHVSVFAAELLARRLPACRARFLPGEGHFRVLQAHAVEILDTLAAAISEPH
jgi:pimeloyl-ACP methyl ester carboxylesterase